MCTYVNSLFFSVFPALFCHCMTFADGEAGKLENIYNVQLIMYFIGMCLKGRFATDSHTAYSDSTSYCELSCA